MSSLSLFSTSVKSHVPEINGNGNAAAGSGPWFNGLESTTFLLCCCGQQGFAELWRRIKMEFTVELPMLRQRWKILLFGLIMQYVHGIFTQLAHRMHQPQAQPLHDVGFDLTPELGPDKFWVSESIFGTLFIMFIFWTFTPFVTQRKRFYTVVMWSRLLMVLVVCQALRIATFSVTQLPGPSFHCRAGEPTATRPWPDHWTGHVVLDVKRAATKSCGDLIFSSHTIFMLTGILAYTEYGSWVYMKWIAWICGAIVSSLIVASRKHYTVDIVIAWYTVPLVFYALYRRWTTIRPMTTELLGALGENDEPDPQESDLERGDLSGSPLATDKVSLLLFQGKEPFRSNYQPAWQQQQQQQQYQPGQQQPNAQQAQQQVELGDWKLPAVPEGGAVSAVAAGSKAVVRARPVTALDDSSSKSDDRQCRIS